ncbi:hypothetical protein LLE49_19590 [Alicyclobacillus tolerans]|uniref:hypothetical protein n=1 Tax=Alicyclobacillus tolerans TaxID=90970 RepID=UPI001F161B24|nr:hypothetical protein [Alicyclobacillus tolerans]MCF8566926.1 hypothetical protein [Alicyclobacillus tolerans]
MYIAEPGDILLYRKPFAAYIPDIAIDLGEMLEDGPQPKYFFHCAIALNANVKLEADGRRVAVHPIDYGKFEPYRPPIPRGRREKGLQYVETMEGQRYDWIVDIDDGLRYLTHNHVHLPVRWVQNIERHAKNCSDLVGAYFNKVMWGPKHFGLNTSPEDIWLAVKDYGVRG